MEEVSTQKSAVIAELKKIRKKREQCCNIKCRYTKFAAVISYPMRLEDEIKQPTPQTVSVGKTITPSAFKTPIISFILSKQVWFFHLQ